MKYFMKNMIYKAKRGKQIIFDDYTDDTKEYNSYGVEMCSHCRNKYRNILGKRVDDGGTACGTCSVKGCENEADYYVDFDENEVKFID